jgi:hypothetical protein
MAGGKLRFLGYCAGLWALGANAAFACEVGEVQLFSCATKAAPQGISLCGQVGQGDQTWGGLRYVQAIYKGKYFEFPSVGAEGPSPLNFSHRTVSKRYEMTERFTVGNDNYTLYYREAARDSLGLTKDQPEARVEIKNPKGRLLKTIACTAAPQAYFKEMREASTCDATPSLIGANCYGKAPDVYLGLDADKAGKSKNTFQQTTEVQNVLKISHTGRATRHHRRHRRH